MKPFILVFALASFVAVPVRATTVGFLNIPSIPGDSVDAAHPGQITIVSFTHIIDRPGAALPTATLLVTKQLDRASGPLAKAAAMSLVLPKVTLSLRRSAEQPYDYYTVTLEDVTVVSFDQTGNQYAAVDSVTFAAAKITWSLVELKPNGTLADPMVESATISRAASGR